ncbi:MAG: alanine racemase [Acidobacteriota bacterium]|nr:alanine racemase [Acidobacteriota bacterium]
MAAAGRDPRTVRVVAVTKTFAPAYVRAAYEAGLRTVGENYAGELAAKREATRDLALTWHFLGALQTNKIARVCANADVLCAVSRERELERIARAKPGARLYVEVDFTGAPARAGAAPGEVAGLVARGRALGLDVAGIMTVAPPEAHGARRAFAATAALADDLGLAERSMGMSDDLELALAHGSTEVRVGRALFGPRGPGGPDLN